MASNILLINDFASSLCPIILSNFPEMSFNWVFISSKFKSNSEICFINDNISSICLSVSLIPDSWAISSIVSLIPFSSLILLATTYAFTLLISSVAFSLPISSPSMAVLAISSLATSFSSSVTTSPVIPSTAFIIPVNAALPETFIGLVTFTFASLTPAVISAFLYISSVTQEILLVCT